MLKITFLSNKRKTLIDYNECNSLIKNFLNFDLFFYILKLFEIKFYKKTLLNIVLLPYEPVYNVVLYSGRDKIRIFEPSKTFSKYITIQHK